MGERLSARTPALSFKPKNPAERKALINSGIANRMLKSLIKEYKKSLGKPFMYKINDCDFWIEVHVDETGEKMIHANIEFPNEDKGSPKKSLIAFKITKRTFGAERWPLTRIQMKVIKQIADRKNY